MKKIISLFLAFLLVASVASAEAIMLPDFEITKDGEITAYYGGEWVVVPENMTFTKDEIIKLTDFQEKYFKSEIRM